MKDIAGNDNLSLRIDRTLDDLAVIRHSLLSGAAQPESKGPAIDLERAGELKTVVDALRHLLWAFIQDASAKSGRSPQEVLEWYKMEMAVELLRAARAHQAATPPVEAQDPESSTFEQLVSNALAVSSQYSGQEPRCQ